MSVKTVVRDPDSKKRAILAAARRLLVSRGFQDIVLDDVAREAGVAKGTLFLHYKDKEQLFEAAFADLVEGLGLELEALPRTGVEGKDLLLATARVILAHFDHSRDFLSQFATGRFPGCGDRSCGRLMDKMRLNIERVEAVLKAAAKDGGRSVPDLRFAAMVFVGLCRTATMRKVVERHERKLEKDAEAVVGFFLDGSGVRL
ncbi:MAG: TetR/AcrR family transcriptional regulator [Elusimicrobiota bacterium]|nr:TetR/AcrR family transcriptional regulator [Elusimicrobiota bacterium]